MPVQVHFCTLKNLSAVTSGNLTAKPAPAIGSIRAREAVAVAGVSTGVAKAGEILILVNTEASAVLVAIGNAPDAAATAATTATSAGFYLAAGERSLPIVPATGDKVSVKAAA
jgi:hypothetical protein